MSDELEPKQKIIYFHIWIDNQEIASFERPLSPAIVGEQGPELALPESLRHKRVRVIPVDGGEA